MPVPPQIIVALILLGFAFAEACRTGLLRKPGATRDDHWADTVSFVALFGIVVPGIFFAVDHLGEAVAPQHRNELADLPLWAGFGLFILFDDLVQYWWHRLAHTAPWLYRFHRPHHEGGYMSVRIVYRNNILYYALMPAIWLSAVLVYLGLGWAYAGYLVVKQLVIIGAHSDVRWDIFLYRRRWLHPLAWVVERTISTPSTHSMHHGKHKADGVTHYKGNYGNLLFFWDVLFGTARISRAYPRAYGTEGLPSVGWSEQILWPIKPGTPRTDEAARADQPA